MLSVRDAVQHMLDSVQPISESETVFIADAVDRVLAQAIHSTVDIPSYDNSAMDGYAMRADDVATPQQTLTLVGQALAGHPFRGTLQAGECIRIMTGAEVPSSASAVIPQEDTVVDANRPEHILFTAAAKDGQNIRRHGEELKIGAPVFAAGHRFTPVDIGLLASLGIADVSVHRRLTIALFSTGDELVAPGHSKRNDQIYDSNRFVLHAMLERLGYQVLNLGLIPDNKQEIADAFMVASARADAIICSGGVSVGDADYTKQVIDELGAVGFWKVAMKPGKPFAFGKVNGTWFFGLPGNPVSATVTFQQLALPTLKRLAGERDQDAVLIQAVAGEPLKKRPGRADFQRGILHHENGENRVYSAGPQGSGMLSSLVQGNCLILLEQDRGDVKAGEPVVIQLLDTPIK